jgi:hypothetical protein
MNSTWITLSQLRSWHRPALIGQRWKIRDGIDDGIVTTNCLEMLYLRDCLDKVGTDFPLRFTKVWPVPIVSSVSLTALARADRANRRRTKGRPAC